MYVWLPLLLDTQDIFVFACCVPIHCLHHVVFAGLVRVT
jgi:hypothetical protein